MRQVLRSFRPFLSKTPPRAGIARKHEGQGMRSLLTFIFQLLDSPTQVPMAFLHGCGKLSLSLGNTVPQASDFIIRHMFHEKRGNISADQYQVHLDGIQTICSNHTTSASAFASRMELCPDNRIRGGKIPSVQTRIVENRAAMALRKAGKSLGPPFQPSDQQIPSQQSADSGCASRKPYPG